MAGLPTIGFGHLIVKGEKFTPPLLGKPADDLLRKDVSSKERDVNRLVVVPLWPGQYDSLLSFTFNVGAGALQKSTMLKRVNAAKHKEVPAQFLVWNKARDPRSGQLVAVRGLTIRRTAESIMYESASQ